MAKLVADYKTEKEIKFAAAEASCFIIIVTVTVIIIFIETRILGHTTLKVAQWR